MVGYQRKASKLTRPTDAKKRPGEPRRGEVLARVVHHSLLDLLGALNSSSFFKRSRCSRRSFSFLVVAPVTKRFATRFETVCVWCVVQSDSESERLRSTTLKILTTTNSMHWGIRSGSKASKRESAPTTPDLSPHFEKRWRSVLARASSVLSSPPRRSPSESTCQRERSSSIDSQNLVALGVQP